MTFDLNLNDIPNQASDLHRDRINNFLLVCKPLDMRGLALLDSQSADIFNRCNGRYDIGEISNLTGYPKDYTARVVGDLWKSGFVNISGRLLQNHSEANQRSFGIDSWFHLTNNCNLSCSYCYIHKTRRGSMSREVAFNAINGLVETAILHNRSKILIKLAGGEPLLKFPLIKKIVAYGREVGAKRGIEIRFHLVTNGICITKEVSEFLKRENINVSVSLDGLNEYNDSQRFYPGGKGSFFSVEKGISRLIDSGINPFILTTVSSSSLPGLPDFTRYLLKRELGFRYSLFRDLESQGNPKDIDPKEALKILNQCYDLFEENLPKRDLISFHQLCDIKFTKRRKLNCGAGSNGVVIGHRGQISICQVLLDQPVGHIGDGLDVLDSIRNQNQFNANERSIDANPECKKCLWRYICGGGCPLLTKSAYGSFEKSSPYCEIFQSCIPRLIRIMGMQMIEKNKNN